MKSKRFPVGTGGGRHPERIEHKRQAAGERAVAWSSLSPREQLRRLDARLGAGVGAKKQRARIARTVRP